MAWVTWREGGWQGVENSMAKKRNGIIIILYTGQRRVFGLFISTSHQQAKKNAFFFEEEQ